MHQHYRGNSWFSRGVGSRKNSAFGMAAKASECKASCIASSTFIKRGRESDAATPNPTRP